jgi:hypothetical protein
MSRRKGGAKIAACALLAILVTAGCGSGESSERESHTAKQQSSGPASGTTGVQGPDESSSKRHCGNIEGFSNGYPANAVSIRAAGMTCEAARSFVTQAHGTPCKLGDCQLAGFTCEDVDAFSQTLIMRCESGSRKLGWAWTIGY